LKSTPPRCFGFGFGFFEEEEEAAAPPFGRPMALAREQAGRSYQSLGGVRGRDSGGRGRRRPRRLSEGFALYRAPPAAQEGESKSGLALRAGGAYCSWAQSFVGRLM